MKRKVDALVQMIKRGGSANERFVAYEKLVMLTGLDYRHLLPENEQPLPDNKPAVKSKSLSQWISEIKANLPIRYSPLKEAYYGTNGFKLTLAELNKMPYSDYKTMAAALMSAITLAAVEKGFKNKYK